MAPTQKPARSNASSVHEPRVLRGLAADQGAAGVPAAGRDPLDETRHGVRVEPPDRDVVEEEERRGARADDVVGAHRDEIDPDRVVAVERRRDGRLRPDPVGRADEDRVAQAGRQPDRSGEAAQPADDLGPAGGLDGRPHELDRPLAGTDVDPAPDVPPAEVSHARLARPHRAGRAAGRRRGRPPRA